MVPSISFNDTPYVVEIPTINEYTNDKLDGIWYSHEDQAEILEDALDAVNGYFHNDKHDPQGLENFLTEGSTRLQEWRQRIAKVVLQEQQWLRDAASDGVVDLLAEASCSVSAECQDQAYLRGYNNELASLPRVVNKQADRSQKTANPSNMRSLAYLLPFRSWA